MRPAGPDWFPQRRWEDQRPWEAEDDELAPIDLARLRRALWLDCDYLGANRFSVGSPHAAEDILVDFHPRRPLDQPPCSCPTWRRGEVCEHVLCVLLHVGDREVVQALRRLVPAADGP